MIYLNFFLQFLLFCLIGYIFGSIAFGLIISKIKHKDLRGQGSGNIGATNTLRVFGVGAAAITFLWDMFKTWLAVCISVIIYKYINKNISFSDYQTFGFIVYFAGLFTIIGHCFPIHYLFFLFKFKFNFEKARKYLGGKGAASTAGFFLATSSWIFIIGFSIFWIVFLIFRYVSVASIVSIFLSTFLFLVPELNYFYLVNIDNANILPLQDINNIHNITINYFSFWWYILNNFLLSFLISIIVIYKHKKNIINLINKKEKKMFFKKNKAQMAERQTQ